MTFDEQIINKCILLAKKGKESVSPNPMVGSIIIYNKQVIGKGYHKEYGSSHAEINAINSVKNKNLLEKSTLYVSLEPCSHKGKTPACTDYIIRHKIPKVVIGSMDINKKASGGANILKKKGVEVITGILEKKCIHFNRRFYIFHKHSRPYVILKWAQTSDGFIAPLEQKLGKSYQISSDRSKKLVHKWRSEEDGIMVGKNTVLKDNPKLTTRLYNGKNPIRIILDSSLEIKRNYNIYNTESKTLIFNKKKSLSLDYQIFIKVISPYDIDNILNILYKKEITSIIVEGGYRLLQNFIKQKSWDEARVFISNKKLKLGIKAPKISSPSQKKIIGHDKLLIYKKQK